TSLRFCRVPRTETGRGEPADEIPPSPGACLDRRTVVGGSQVGTCVFQELPRSYRWTLAITLRIRYSNCPNGSFCTERKWLRKQPRTRRSRASPEPANLGSNSNLQGAAAHKRP